MNSFLRNLKLCFLVLSPLYVFATDLSPRDQTILSQIQKLVAEPYYLYPILPEATCDYQHFSFIKDSEQNSLYAVGMIKQGNNSLI